MRTINITLRTEHSSLSESLELISEEIARLADMAKYLGNEPLKHYQSQFPVPICRAVYGGVCIIEQD